MRKRYVVYPGPVVSRTDGDVHEVPAENLIRLYGVDRRECVIVRPGDIGGRRIDGLIPLRPDPSGRYKVPERNE